MEGIRPFLQKSDIIVFMMMFKTKMIIHKIAVILAILCICIALPSCGDEELYFRDYIDGKNLKELELILVRNESPNVTWYIGYSEESDGQDHMEETEVSPFGNKDYRAFSEIDGLENLYIQLGDGVSADEINKIFENLPKAEYIGFSYCPEADFSVLNEHIGFDDVAFTNGCDVSTLPVLDAKVIGFSNCDNIPWDIVGQMNNVEQIRYSSKETLNQYAFLQMAEMKSLKILYYLSFPYDEWNWGDDDKDYTQPPYKISSIDDIEDWVYNTIDRESFEQFFSQEDRIMILYPYMETNPGIS